MKFIPKQLNQSRDNSRGKAKIKDWVKGLASIALILVLGYLLLGLIADGVASSISEETEVNLFQWIDVGEVPADNEQFVRAQLIFERLTKLEGLRPLPYRLALFDAPMPNAFALPGGLVCVTSELLNELDSDIGLAFVLAHELGHHQHRHVLKRLGRTLLQRIVVSWISGQGDMMLLNNGVALASLSYSRNQEYEADYFGLNLVHQAYGTTDGAYQFFEQMLRVHGHGSHLENMLQTHPLTEDRIERLEEIAGQLEPSSKL